ncbi:checkpoint protein HUS1 [Anopheles bellator]|uniref:checkpoint protein HUS1 n=1 Tax=Anopheles bellator TaxID=139047 RepID=UPI00264990F5|nr:checkpoint protein HUS1 [Anopheles bellator]
MKFRAVVSEDALVKAFLQVVSTVSKADKQIIINVQPTKMILQIEAAACEGQYVWCEMVQGRFFSEFAMDGIDATHNQIYMVAQASSFVRALSFVRHSTVRYLKIKLIKTAATPCLSFEIAGDIDSNQDVIYPKVEHSLPVTIMPRSEWQQFQLPHELRYDISIALPTIKSLRALLEKKKNLAPTVTLYVTMNGELSLVVETDVVTVASHYRDLELSPRCGRVGQESTKMSEASCRVETRKLAALFETIYIFGAAMTASIRHEQALIISCDMLQACVLNFILPAMNFE